MSQKKILSLNLVLKSEPISKQSVLHCDDDDDDYNL
jgi:hypothetical protein